ncbi:MAG: TIGR03084 family metal-binding protein, partial [Nocardioidaceae bacterium]
WDVKDQVSHLAFFDETATLSAVDPDAFLRAAEDLVELGEDFTEHVARLHHHDPGPQLLAWFTDARRTLLSTFAALDAATTLPWFGPPMSAASSVTARLMETWAHGQDVADALGVVREPTHRLRHVAHIGVSTIGWSFRLRGLEPPTTAVRVELVAPDGSSWTWGPEDATERVTGTAEDFCLLVTQRRHRDDLRLRTGGPTMAGYLEVAQAFAGPPGPGRARLGAGQT